MNNAFFDLDSYKFYLLIYLAITMGGVWLGLLYWTIRDIKHRTHAWISWVISALLVLFFFIPGFAIYLLFRPKQTLDETFYSHLQEEVLMRSLVEPVFCPKCKHEINQEWLVCPICHTPLCKPCLKCGKHIDINWSVCPFCGSENLKTFTDLSIKKQTD